MQRLVSTIRHNFNSVTVLHSQMKTLREQLKVLEVGLTKSKDHCRTALRKIGIGAKYVENMIKDAEAEAEVDLQKNPELHRVYRSWEKVQEKKKEIHDAEKYIEE